MLILKVGYSQNLTYKYPLSQAKYEIDIEKVEMRTERFENLDSIGITYLRKINSDITSITTLENGRIISIENLIDNHQFNFKYDDLLNIKSRISNNPVSGRSSAITYHLNYEELILQAFKDGSLIEEVFFDKFNRVKYRNHYSTISTGPQVHKTEMTYNEKKLVGKKGYTNGILVYDSKIKETIKETNHSKSNTDEENNIVITKVTTTTTTRIEKEDIVHNTVVKYFDCNENLLKKYIFSCDNGFCSGFVAEFELSKTK